MLERIHSPEDLKQMDIVQLETLAEEIRNLLIKTISCNGGHLASNLGAVELTLALHHVFSCPEDQFVWDVGHQSYTHKLLTGRRELFSTIRRPDGISGYPKRQESRFDAFVAGHASTSISVAEGVARAKALKGESGWAVADLPNRYYILLLSGAGGRVMVRQFTQGSYEELKANLDRWYADLRLVNRSGTGEVKPVKLSARLIRLLKRQNSDKKVFERLQKELPGLTTPVFHAIIQGTRLPDSVAVRALQRIRSQMLTEEPDGNGALIPDPISCQWLKVWLIRTHKEADLMSEYNPNHPNPVYHIGAMVAVYAALQRRAYPNVNVTVVQRFFASAQQTPALVLGRLAKMSTHHLAKLESKKAADYFASKLADISARIGDGIPTVLELPGQSLFALGYYQMSAALNRERRERLGTMRTEERYEEE